MRKLYLLLTALLFIACDQGNVPNAPLQIMPLKVGNRWIGRITEYDTNGNVASTRFDTLTVYKSEVVNGETWYYRTMSPAVLTIRNGNPDSLLFDTVQYAFTNRVDGLYQAEVTNFANPHCIAKYPATEGDTMSKRALYTFDTSLSFTTVDLVRRTNALVTVPAGIFHCYQYQSVSFQSFRGTTMDSSRYYAPGVGIVQYEYNLAGPYDSTRFTQHREIWQLVRAELH
jgi:hypothetical protein